MTHYLVEEHILIDAAIEVVWQHLTDWEAYPQWNPFIVAVQYTVNAQNNVDKMKFSLRWHDGRPGTSWEQMVSSSPPAHGHAELVYKYASLSARLGLLRATRVQQLRASGQQTVYYTKEQFSGILARFVPFTAVKKGFAAQAKALAKIASGQ